MAIRFRVRDFAQPVALLRYRRLFAGAQWWHADRLRAYQRTRLQAILSHAAAHVPYYRDAFRRAGLNPADVGSVADLAPLSFVSKSDLRHAAAALRADNASRFRPTSVSTTGSTELPVTVLLDRQTRAMEFAFYWRHWGWFGYRLGDRFAQLSWSDFAGEPAATLARAERGTGRLLLNALSLSQDRVSQFAAAMRAHRSRFLKGHASALLHFALFVRSARLQVPRLSAVFSTGEVLEPSMRSVIQEVFQAPVADSYGQMERVVAACECPRGRMHMNEDYGAWEAVDVHADPGSGKAVGRLVGTSLHNLSMPLIRYDTGDVVEIDERGGPCPCGRSFPVIGRILGRSVDAIVAPDGRVVTVAAIVFNAATGILQGQLVQHELGMVLARVLPAPAFSVDDERRLRGEIQRLIGPSMRVELERVECLADLTPAGTKHRPVISTVYQQVVANGRPLP